MPQDATSQNAIVGRASIVFACVCFVFGLAMFGGALYILPLSFKAKFFLSAAGLLLSSLFVFMAVATFLVLRPRASRTAATSAVEKASETERPVMRKVPIGLDKQ